LSNHKSAIVPIEAWSFASPELLTSGNKIDVGLFAESLVYYDTIYLVPGNPELFSILLKWFSDQDKLEEFRALVEDGIIKIYDYAFISTAISKNGMYQIWNIQDNAQEKGSVFEQRYLYSSFAEAVLPKKARLRSRFYNAFQDNFIEAKAADFAIPIENARADYTNPKRNEIILQAFIDEVYKSKNLGSPPEVKVKISKEGKGVNTINWNIDFDKLSDLAGVKLNFNSGTPLTANAHSNRLIWSAAELGCDLFLPRPMSLLVGDKLFESTHSNKTKSIIEELNKEVEFPNIRKLVNSGQLNLSHILNIRKNSQKFRNWLQNESDRDRNTLFAYHTEIAKTSGIASFGKSTLNLFGIIGGGALSGWIGAMYAGPVGGVVGSVAGSTLGFLTNVASKIGDGWKPIVFGNWLDDRIKKIIK
jgi:hypothetical protein